MVENKNNALGQDDAYFDLIDILEFIWRARLFIVMGASIGLSVGWLVCDWTNPPIYIATVPVKLVRVAGTSNDLVKAKLDSFISEREVSAFNALLSDSGTAGEIYDILDKETNPLVRSAMLDNHLTRENFISYQLKGAGIVPIRLLRGPGENELAAQCRFLKSDAKGVLSSAIVQATSQAIIAHNARLLKEIMKTDSTTSDRIDEGFLYRQVIKMRLADEFVPRTALLKLEEKLLQRLGSNIASSLPNESDQIIRLMMRLVSAGKMSEIEVKEIQRQRNILIAELEVIKAKYDIVLREAELPLKDMSLGILQKANGEKNELLRIVVDDEALNQKIKTSSLEQYQSKRALFTSLGLALGTVLGVFVSVLKRYLFANRKRITAIFKS